MISQKPEHRAPQGAYALFHNSSLHLTQNPPPFVVNYQLSLALSQKNNKFDGIKSRPLLCRAHQKFFKR